MLLVFFRRRCHNGGANQEVLRVTHSRRLFPPPLAPIGPAMGGLAAIVLLVGATAATAVDHFRVYPDGAGFGPNDPVVQIDDQFGTTAATAVDHFRVYPNGAGFGLNGSVVQIDDQFGTTAATAVDHFRVYPNDAGFGLNGPIVQIDDQFGTQTTDLGNPIRFLVPVEKNGEGLADFFSHLTCYQIVDGVAGPAVTSTNQFGVQPLTLGVPDTLCVPTEKLIAPGPVNVDHYKCYLASGAAVDVGVSLQDQFGSTSAIVLSPRLFCTPASKNGEPISDPVAHLTCYDTTPPGLAPGPIPILNQFTDSPDTLGLLEADMVCVPSTKQVVAPGTDHFQSYPVSAATGIEGPVVQIEDQLGTQTTNLGSPIRFLVPVDKNDEGIDDPFSHSTCYQITDGVAGPPVISTNQFGVQPLTLGVPESLCVPTEKLITPGLVDLDHYKCYLATGAPVDLGVSLVDQFQARSTLVLDPKLFCTPADKNGEGIDDPLTHLTCYSTSPIGQAPGLIPIVNQFIAGDQLDLLEADLLCAPSTKQLVPPVEHFMVYNATGPDGPPVTIADQFGTQVTDLGDVSLFMVPVEKNAEAVFDPFTHLSCHDIQEAAASTFLDVTVTNQFVTDQPLDIGDPRELCVPTEKLIAPGPIDGDHYRCWEVTDPSGVSLAIGVTLADQFQGFSSLVMDPFRLCNPADKNGELIQDPDSHLVCYTLQPESDVLGLSIPIQNQFFALVNVELDRAIALCAPSVKTVPEPGVWLGLACGAALLAGLDRRRRARAD